MPQAIKPSESAMNPAIPRPWWEARLALDGVEHGATPRQVGTESGQPIGGGTASQDSIRDEAAPNVSSCRRTRPIARATIARPIGLKMTQTRHSMHAKSYL